STVTPRRASRRRASDTKSLGDWKPDGWFTTSRAQIVASAMVEPRSRPRFTSARPSSTTTRRNDDAVADDLYSRNWYAPSSTPSANASAAAAGVAPAGTASSSVVATLAIFEDARDNDAPARRTPSSVIASGSPTPRSSTA